MTTNIISALGAGSGIDVKALAESLVEAERAPQQALIDKNVARSEAKISGFAAVKYALSELKNAFSKLNDASDFVSISARNSQPQAFAVSTASTAAAGNFSFKVNQVALPQRSVSTAFAESGSAIGGSSSFNLQLSLGGTDSTIQVTNPTPAGMVSAINGAGLGITAQLVNTGAAGNPYSVVVSGATGASNAFTLEAFERSEDGSNGEALDGLDFGGGVDGAPLQVATNAQVELNGLAIERSSNVIDDVLTGVTFDLYAATDGAARLDLARETTGIKDNLNNLVLAYNDFAETMKILGDRSSDVEEFGGALAGVSLLQTISTQVRSMVSGTSSTPGSAVQSASDVGLNFDRYGKLSLDESRLDTVLENNFSQVVTMFSADTNNQSVFSASPGGVAGDAVNSIDRMLRSTGLVEQQTTVANKEIERYKEQLEVLDFRMEKLLTRYTTQFGLMESIVGNSNSMRASLKSSFDGMMSMYSN